MKIDFDGVEDVADYVTVPPGTYLCKIAEVRTGSTRNGDERWSMRLVIAEGEFTGRLAAFDSLVFSPRGKMRAAQVLGALGLPNSGCVEVSPEDLVDRLALVEIRHGEFQHPDTERVVRRNEVPYSGYRPVPENGSGAGAPPAGTAPIPF